MKNKERFKAIWFNLKQEQLYQSLKNKGLTSLNFKDFVKSAFHKEVDRIRALSGSTDG